MTRGDDKRWKVNPQVSGSATDGGPGRDPRASHLRHLADAGRRPHRHPISDGTFIPRPAYFGDDATADGHGDLFDRHGQAWLPIGGFLVRSGDRCVLVDPGLAIRTRDRLCRELEGDDVTGAGAHFPELRFGRVLSGSGKRWWT